MHEGEVLMGVGALLLGQPDIDRRLQVLRRLRVVALLVLLEAGVERRAAAHRAEDRSPEGMPRFCLLELKPRVGGERLAELVAALALAVGGAMDEGEVLVRDCAVAGAEPQLEGGEQLLGRSVVGAGVVMAQPLDQRHLRLGRLHKVLEHRAAREGGNQGGGNEQSTHQRKRCWIFTASPGFTSTRATCAGKVVLRISMVCGPGETSSTRSGGLTPRLLPSTSTSPHGATASSRRA